MTKNEKNDMINPLLIEADFFRQSTERWLKKVKKNLKKVLTGNRRHDIISELLKQTSEKMKKELKKINKKVLDKLKSN